MSKNYSEKSILKTKVIKNVLLNKKDYTFQDFKFKIVKAKISHPWENEMDVIEVYNFEDMILKIEYALLNGYVMINGKSKDLSKEPPT